VARKSGLDLADEEAWERRSRIWRLVAVVVVIVICLVAVVVVGIWIWDHRHASYHSASLARGVSYTAEKLKGPVVHDWPAARSPEPRPSAR
jgi:hypothetical protein